MDPERFVLGLFSDDVRAGSAIRALRSSAFTLQRVQGPFPSRHIAAALALKKSPVGYFTLAGGIFGFLFGFGLAIFTAVQWNLMVGGKPIVAWVTFLIVAFEFTILFAVFGNVIGMLTQARLPRTGMPAAYDPRSTGTHFGVLASCRAAELEGLADFFRQRGAEIRVFV